MKFLKQASMLRLCVAIGMMMIGITGCKPKITPAAVYYTVTLQVSGAEGGTLKAMINNKPVETGSETNIPVLSGTKITMTARPREGYNIGAWTGVTVGTGAATAEIVITKDSSVTVKFIKKPAGGGSPNPSTPNQPQTQNPSDQTQEYTVTFSVKDNTGGTLTATANGKNLENETKVKAGTKVRFTATPKSAEGYTVGAWTGTDAAVGTGAVELIITQDVNVTVAFVKITRYGVITFDASKGGSISAKVEGNTDNLQSGGTAPYGSSVTFTAVPEDGYVFDRWEGLTDTPSEGTATYTVTGDRYVKAYFKSAALPYLAVNEHGRLWYKGDESRKNEILKGRIVIPESMYGVPVTTIVGYTFSNCTELTEVVIPRTVITIEQSMCQGCTKLKKVTLQGEAANALTTIGDNAFYGCYALDEVRLPQNVKSIGSQAFENCRSLTIYLPRTIETIWGSAFGRKAKESNYDSCVKTIYVPLGHRSRIGGLIDKGIDDCCYFPGEKMKEYDDTKPIP
mgnify:CR=1 FL=1